MRILNIQRMSTEDGPGLRTSVFFKGCPLTCAWCHNPESIPYKFDKEWIESSCMFCLDCVKICPESALSHVDNKIVINRDKCSWCMQCIETCPTLALKAIGKDITPEELYEELIKDKAYFGNGGGITLSGGEALIQSKEIVDLLKLLKKDGIHIAIDTSGYLDFKNFEIVSPYVDLYLYDLKLDSSKLHEQFCGKPNDLIKENLIKLNALTNSIWIRTPIIPDSTDSITNISGIANFLKDNEIDFERWELCAFNNLCKDKYKRLYMKWSYDDAKLMTKEKMDLLKDTASSILPKMQILATGATKLEVNNE